MKTMKVALLATAALAAVSVSARADDTAAIKAQLEALTARIAQLEAAPAVPVGFSLLTISEGTQTAVPGLEVLTKDRAGSGEKATIIGILPTADAPASTTIEWSGYVRAAIVHVDYGDREHNYYTASGSPTGTHNDDYDEDLDIYARGQLKVVGKTDTTFADVAGLLEPKQELQEVVEFLRQPGFFGTHATMGADLSQLMATLFTGLFIIGWLQAKQHRGHYHPRLLLGGMVTLVGFFTAYYLFRQLRVLAFEGNEGFGGSQALYDYVFIPVLTIHIILVIIGLVMAVYMIVLGFRSQQFLSGARVLSAARLLTSWKKVSLIFAALLAVVMLLFGTRVMSAGFSMRKLEVYIGFLTLVAIVFAVEMGIQRIWPDGGQRHRALGRFTMIVYCILFLTGTFTYAMLYILCLLYTSPSPRDS